MEPEEPTEADIKKAKKLAKKEEKKRLAIEKNKQLQRDHLEREVKYGEQTYQKYEKKWRSMLIEIALPRVKRDFELAWHHFQRTLDCKDFVISLLMDELDQSEQQYMRNFRSHVDNIDNLLELFQDRIKALKEDSNQRLADIEKEYQEENSKIAANSEENEVYLKTMLYALEMERKNQELLVRAEYYSKAEDEESKANQIVQGLKGFLENKFIAIYDEAQNYILSHQQQIKDRKRAHDSLKKNDDALQEMLKTQLEKIAVLSEHLKKLREKYNNTSRFLGSRLDDLQEEQDYFSKAFLRLKKKLESDRQDDVEQLRLMTLEFDNTMKYLTEVKMKGENILNLAAICRKLETQEEKILPFPSVGNEESHKTSEIKVTKDMHPELTLFWQKLGQAEASKYAIKEERAFLNRQNNRWINIVKTYCNCVDCPDMPSRQLKKTPAQKKTPQIEFDTNEDEDWE